MCTALLVCVYTHTAVRARTLYRHLNLACVVLNLVCARVDSTTAVVRPCTPGYGGGLWAQAKEFVRTVVEWAGSVRDVSIFGWQAEVSG